MARITWEYIVGDPTADDWTRRLRVHDGWIVQTMYRVRFENPLLGITVNVVQSVTETFVRDPENWWCIDEPTADAPAAPQACPECHKPFSECNCPPF